MKRLLIFSFAALALAAAARPAQAQAEQPVPDKPAPIAVAYDQVRPVLQKRCVTCHDEGRNKGDLDLSSLEGIKAGGVSGPAVVSGNPDESPIYLLTAHLDNPKMPPNNPKIPQREIDLIRRWIEGGLVDRGNAVKAAAPADGATPGSAPAATMKSAVPAEAGASMAIAPVARPTPITALAASPAAPLVALSGPKQVVLFRWTDRSPLKAFAFPEGDVFALRFSRDGKLLVAGGGVGGLSGRVVGFEVATGKRLFELGDERDAVLAVDISADKSLVALGGPGRAVKVFRTSDGELTATLRKHIDWILSLAFSPEGLLLASGDRFGGLQVWEAQSGKEFQTLRGHVGPVTALGWSADSERLLSAGQDDSLRFWNMHDGTQTARWNGGVGGILAVDIDTAGRVVCGGRERKLAVWERPEAGVRQMSLPDEVVKLAVSHDSSHVIAGDAAGNVAVFNLTDGALTGNLSLPVAPAIASAQAPVLANNKPRQPKPQTVNENSAVAAAEAEVRQAAIELAEARDALAAAESAVKSAEESLKQLRQTAAKLAIVVSRREAAARKAAEPHELETPTDTAR